MIKKNIAIIGAGHMGQALAEGLLRVGVIEGNRLVLANPHLEKLEQFCRKYKVELTTNNIEATKFADILIIAVRPKVVKEVIEEIRTFLKGNTLVIVVAACITFELLKKYFHSDRIKITRIMPNIPVAYSLGVVGWVVNKNIGSSDKKLMEKLLSPLGIAVSCKSEKELDRIDIISGCGPGIIAYFIHNFAGVAKSYGFSSKEATEMAHHVFAGTIAHLQKTGLSVEDLITKVSTKGGITEEVIKSLDESKFYIQLKKSFDAGYAKIGKITMKLEKELGNDKL